MLVDQIANSQRAERNCGAKPTCLPSIQHLLPPPLCLCRPGVGSFEKVLNFRSICLMPATPAGGTSRLTAITGNRSVHSQ